MITATRREQGPATSCSKCNEGPIRGFNVVDTEHGIHSVMCADCAMEAVTDTDPDVESMTKVLSACCGAAVTSWKIDNAFCDDDGVTCDDCNKAADIVQVTPSGILSLASCSVCWDCRPEALTVIRHSIEIEEALCGPCLGREYATAMTA